MIKAILFDCFGVIITDALELVIQRHEADNPQLRDDIMDIVHANNLGLLDPAESNRQIGELLGVDAQEYRRMIDSAEVKDERVLEWIRQLHGRYKTALLSNIGRDSMHRRFSEQELAECFDETFISGELGIAKPQAEIYRYAAERLGVDTTECVFLDDREGHCQGARETGMRAVLYKSYDQARSDLEKILAK